MSEAAETPRTGDDSSTCERCRATAHKRRVRAWRWLASLDLTKPPAPMLRWSLLLILGLSCWGAGLPLNVRDWLGPIIIAGALILPDVAGFGIAGMRLDLKHTKDELAALKLRVDIRQTQKTEVHLHRGSERVLAQAVEAEVGEQAAKNEAITIIDASPGGEVTS
jgi:hypothetical protein